MENINIIEPENDLYLMYECVLEQEVTLRACPLEHGAKFSLPCRSFDDFFAIDDELSRLRHCLISAFLPTASSTR